MVNITAVEWLIAKAKYERNFNLEDALQEAMRMEKDQIIVAYAEGEARSQDNAETYFEQTYREI